MYPQGELKRLACGKAGLRQRIGAWRTGTAETAARVTEPLARVDRAFGLWRGLPPWSRVALVTISVVVARKFLLAPRTLRRLLRWSPFLFHVARSFRRTAGR